MNTVPTLLKYRIREKAEELRVAVKQKLVADKHYTLDNDSNSDSNDD
jgi:hypothetical protein